MEKREPIFYFITCISLIFLIIISISLLTKIPNIANEKFMSLTGNVVLNLENNFKVGDTIQGDIVVNKNGGNEKIYGMILLTKEGEPVITKTFRLNEVLKGEDVLKIQDLIDYRFEESGNYELLFSVLDLDINIKKGFVVK